MGATWDVVYKRRGIKLICGDSYDVLPALADESVDFILTDPPYGHNNNDGDLISNIEKACPARRNKRDHVGITAEQRAQRKDLSYEARPIANDDPDATKKLVKFIIKQGARLLVKGGNMALCCSGGGGPGTIEYANWSIWLDRALKFKQMVVWDKGPMGIGLHYRRSYEVVLVATKPGAACKWYDDTQQVENVLFRGANKIIPQEGEHPTPKPVKLMQFFLGLHTQPGDLVLDPCMGRAPVAEACRLMGRRYIGIELNPHWAKEAAKRLAALALQPHAADSFGPKVRTETEVEDD